MDPVQLSTSTLQTVKVSLDWTPNTSHAAVSHPEQTAGFGIQRAGPEPSWETWKLNQLFAYRTA